MRCDTPVQSSPPSPSQQSSSTVLPPPTGTAQIIHIFYLLNHFFIYLSWGEILLNVSFFEFFKFVGVSFLMFVPFISCTDICV